MDPLIKEPVTITSIAATDRVYLGHPSVLALPGGRILAAVDAQGPDLRALPGTKSRFADTNHWIQGRLFASQDEGHTWTPKMDFPFGYPCLFRDANQLYLLGHRGTLTIMRSADGGETWSKPVELTPKGGDAAVYSHGPCSVLRADGHFCVALLRTTGDYHRRITPDTLVPVLLRAPEGFNLTVAKSWIWSEPGPTLAQAAPDPAPGLPLFASPVAEPPPPATRAPTPPSEVDRGLAPSLGSFGGTSRTRSSAPQPPPPAPGWTYPHAVAVPDARHAWHDPSGRTAHVLFSVPSPRGNAALISRFVTQADGVIRAEGRPLWISLPGGQRRFHLLWDADSRHHWLLSTQARGSLLRPEPAPGGRSEPAAAHPRLLQLCYANNLVDWVQAGWVAGTPADPLMDPAMDLRGRDLCVVACARDAADPGARHSKRLIFGLVRDFRNLLYGTT